MLFLSLYPYRRRDFQGWNAPCSHWPRSLVQGLCVAAVQVNDSGGLLFLLFEVDTAVIPWAGSSWSHARNLGLSHIPMPIISPTPCAASIILTQKHHLGSKDNTNPCCRKKKLFFFPNSCILVPLMDVNVAREEKRGEIWGSPFFSHHLFAQQSQNRSLTALLFYWLSSKPGVRMFLPQGKEREINYFCKEPGMAVLL